MRANTKPRRADTPFDAGTDDADEYRPPLPRLTSRVFGDLELYGTGLGLAIGLVFPFFTLLFGVPREYVITPYFFGAAISAGLLVGVVTHRLSRAVVGSRLRFLGSRMNRVEQLLTQSIDGETELECTPEKCRVPVDSNDELGSVAQSFNRLVEAQAAAKHAAAVGADFAAVLTSHIELQPLVDAALSNLRGVGDFTAAALCVLEDGATRTISAHGLVDGADLADSEIVARALRTLECVEVDLPEDLTLDGGVVEFRPRAVIACPLQVRLVPIGVLVLASSQPISAETRSLVQPLLPSFAVALNNSLSHEKLQRVAAVDGLTGLYNRRFGLERLSQDFSRSVRSGEPLGAILFDIDHFKVVNDTYGHEAGDVVLKRVATEVRNSLREGDTLMRYGGEEFLAVLPGAGRADISTLGERIRRVVESTTIEVAHQQLNVTVSLGAVSFPSEDVTDVDDMIRRADAAMYDAKHAGRNRLAFIPAA